MPSLLDHRHRIHLNQPFRPNQPLHHHKRAGRRIRCVYILVADFSHRGNLRGIHTFGAVVVQLHDILEISACRFNRGPQILEDLLHLHAEVVPSDQVAVLVLRHLPGDEHHLAFADLGNLRIPSVGLTMVSGLKIFTCGASGPFFGSLVLAAFASWADKTGPQPSTMANTTQPVHLMIRSLRMPSTAPPTILAANVAVRFPQWKQRKKFMPAPYTRGSRRAKMESGGSTRNAKKDRIGNRSKHHEQSAQSTGSQAGSHPRRNCPTGLPHLSRASGRGRKSLRGLETGRAGATRRSRQAEVPRSQVQGRSFRCLSASKTSASSARFEAQPSP